jgi:small-conductance mechanosensitive channel
MSRFTEPDSAFELIKKHKSSLGYGPRVLFLICAITTIALGQDTPADPSQADTAKTKADQTPTTIAPSDIAPRSEEVSTRLGKIRDLCKPVEAVIEIEKALPSLGSEVATQRAELEHQNFRPSLRRLGNVRTKWAELSDKLETWQPILRHRAAELQLAQDDVSKLSDTWQRTLATEVPEALRTRIQGILTEIESTTALLQAQLDAALTLQSSASEHKLDVVAAMDLIDALEAKLRDKLLIRDSDPIWEVFSARSENPSLAAQVRQSWNQITEELSSFKKKHGDNIPVHITVFVGLVIAMVLLGRGVPASARQSDIVQQCLIITQRPIAAALLIALLLSPTIYPNMPPAVREVARLVLLLPMLRLLPAIIPDRGRNPVYFLAVLFILQKLELLMQEDLPLSRLFLLGNTTLGVVALVGWLWRHPSTQTMPVWHRALRCLGWLAMVGQVVSLLANVYGAVLLAGLLTAGIINSALLIVLLWVSTTILVALTVLWTHTRAGRALRSVQTHSDVIQKRIGGALRAIAVIAWVLFSLKGFGVRQAVMQWAGGVLSHPWGAGTVSLSLGGIIAFGLSIWLAITSARVVRFCLEEELLPRMALPRGVPSTISTMTGYAIIGLGVVVAFAAAGVELSKITLVGGALSLGIGFGLQNIVNNFISGLILIFERPIQIGDAVEFGQTRGIIRRIGIRSSTVRTWQGAEVIVPNANLISSEVINWTLSDRSRRIDLLVPVAYGADPRKVEALLFEVAGRQEHAANDPAPRVVLTEFSPNGLIFELRCWTADASELTTLKNDLAIAVHDALHEAGYKIPTTQHEVQLHTPHGLP